MSYLARDNSSQNGAPVHLFMFVQGESTWRYTTTSYPVTALASDWEPGTIVSGDINQSNDVFKDTLSLEIPRDYPLAVAMLEYSPDTTTSVTIYRGHSGELEDLVVYWKGRVAGSRASGEAVTLECESISTSLRRPGLRARYQRTCRHSLYSSGCGVPPASYELPMTATYMSGLTVTVPGAISYPNGWFLGGMISAPDGSLRLITSHVGSSLTLSRSWGRLSEAIEGSGGAGVPVKVYPGCDRSLGAGGCAKFNNVANYGGFPWIPNKNPYGGSSIV